MSDMPESAVKMPGLSASRWNTSSIPAWPRPPPASISASSSPPVSASSRPSPEQELSRFLKIVARLNWKLPFLNHGYDTAINRTGKTQQEVEANEIHFKLDFHEFYMLIERALVHLMGVFGIVIYAQRGFNGNGVLNGNGNGHDVGPGESIKISGFRERISQHRYHANVLTALDDPTNPLHGVFGTADVRQQLLRAKNLRNRWKNADDGEPQRFMPAPLEAYNLEKILQTIFAAFDQAYLLAEQYVRENVTGRDAGPVSAADWSTEERDWEFMVDAMDWEAV
ncbi:hypothetical protein F4779DRAFT_601388 [Xylariaceae sp. FL0662B]|nr:hypothetical protein F4779DRAFT_601388 [Xylariaceae sp. FL0662B]